MASTNKTRDANGRDLNPDPITGEPGAHPVGVAAGGTAGAAAGAAIGSMAGPVGTAVGGAVGAVAGGLAGKGVAEAIDPTETDEYLQKHFHERSYVKKGETFDTYRPAYRYGGMAESRYQGRTFDEIEPDLRGDWESTHASSTGMGWDRARHAVRDAFDRTIHIRKSRTTVK
jgi:hypothetical protein